MEEQEQTKEEQELEIDPATNPRPPKEELKTDISYQGQE